MTEIRGSAERHVHLVQESGEKCSRNHRRWESGFEVGLHQGSALRPFLFAMIMDRMKDDIRLKSPWNVMFADDIVICNESREGVERELEKWRAMKVSRSITRYMCVNGKKEEEKETIKVQGVAIARVSDFKYLGVTLQSNGDSSVELKKRVQAGWNGW